MAQVGGIRARRAERKRNEILQAGLKVFARKGFHAATMDDIALELEATKGLLYYHFRTKEELLQAVLSDDALLDAIAVAALFNIIDRVADALGFDVPPPEAFAARQRRAASDPHYTDVGAAEGARRPPADLLAGWRAGRTGYPSTPASTWSTAPGCGSSPPPRSSPRWPVGSWTGDRICSRGWWPPAIPSGRYPSGRRATWATRATTW